MLDVALVYQKAFNKLEDLDKKYGEEFVNDILVESDWLNIKNLSRFLKRFYDITCKLSGSAYSTSSLYFPEVMKILKDITLCENSKNPSLEYMGIRMRAKFDKYWGSLDTMNMMLFVVVVLDPRYKMKYLMVKYTEFYGENDAKELVGQVTNIIIALLDEYKVKNVDLGAQISKVDKMDDEIDEDIDDYFLNVDKDNVVTEGDWERYINELPEKYVVDFDLLLWWKVNSLRYPALSQVAKDVSAIQCSIVASESTFSTSGRTLDQFRSSLTPATAAVLICCQDWLKTSTSAFKYEEELDDLEAIEHEISSDPEVAESLKSIFQLDC
ncbi:Zinc finger BED domain-containing protein RICESLEEPER 2 [Euphorbia peplus]|nr:Zinc finger BED domain-containing protein RICESLEEPER 2 [Euphorbia peplus]